MYNKLNALVGLESKMIKVLTAWNFRARECRSELVRTMPSAAENLKEEAVRSKATITGDEVLGKARQGRRAWNFRASECRAELVRAMPSAAENLKEVALRHRTCLKYPLNSCKFVRPSRSPFSKRIALVSIREIRGHIKISRGQQKIRALYAIFSPEKPVNPALISLTP